MSDKHSTGSEEELAQLRRLAGAMLQDMAGADDLIQEYRIITLGQDASEVRSVRGWSRTVIRNLARKEKKSREGRARREAIAARQERVENDPSAELQRLALREHLVRTIHHLDERYRSVIQDHYFEGLPLRQIAAASGRPLSTIKSHLRRGLAELRGRLEPEFGTDKAFGLALLGAVDWDKRTITGYAAPATVFGVAWATLALPLGMLAALCVLIPLAAWRTEQARTNNPVSTGEAAQDANARSQPDKLARGSAEAVPRQGAGPASALKPSTTTADDPPIDQTSGSQVSGASAYALRVVDEDGAPVPGAEVWKGWDATFELLGRTASDGVLSFAWGPGDLVEHQLVTGRGRTNTLVGISLQARSPHHASSWRFFVHPERRPEREVDLLLRGPALTISGLVRDRLGQAMPGAEVSLVFQRGEPGKSRGVLATHFDVAPVRADTEGRFLFSGLPQDLHVLAARLPGYPSSSVSVDGRDQSNMEVQIELQRGATLPGVVRGAGGVPAAGASIRVTTLRRLHEDRWETTSDDAGRFEVDGVPPGPLRIEASSAAGAADRDIAFDPTHPDPLELQLGRVVPLSVRVVDTQGLALPGIEILVSQRRSPWQRFMTSGDNGIATLERCPPGAYRLIARRTDPGYLYPIGMADVDSVPEGPVTLVCDPREESLCAVRGRIQPAAGWTLRGSFIQIRHLASRISYRLHLESDDVDFSLSKLTPGAYEILFHSPRHGQVLLTRFDASQGIEELGTLPLPELGSLKLEWNWPLDQQVRGYRFRQFVKTSNNQGAITLIEGLGAPEAEWQLAPSAWILLAVDANNQVVQQRMIVVRSGGEHSMPSGPSAPGIANLEFHSQVSHAAPLEIRVHDVAPAETPADLSAVDQDTLRAFVESSPQIYHGSVRQDPDGVFCFGLPLTSTGWRVVAGRFGESEWRYFDFRTKVLKQMWHAWDL